MFKGILIEKDDECKCGGVDADTIAKMVIAALKEM